MKKWVKIPSRNSASSFVLLFSSLVWYFMILSLLESTFPNETVLWLAYFATILISSFAAPYFVNALGRAKWLYLWTSLGVAVSFLSFLLVQISNQLSLLVFYLLGLSFGIGMPSCLTYFVNSTTLENRGRKGGIAFLFTIILMPIIVALFRESFSATSLFIALGIWRLTWLLVLLWLKIPKEEIEEKTKVTFKKVIQDRSFVFYLIPWLCSIL